MNYRKSLQFVIDALLIILLGSTCGAPQPAATTMPTATPVPMLTAINIPAPTITPIPAPSTITPTFVKPTSTLTPIPTASAGQIQAVDVNGDGVIDRYDVLILALGSIEINRKLDRLLKIPFSEITQEELMELKELTKELHFLNNQLEATGKVVFPNATFPGE